MRKAALSLVGGVAVVAGIIALVANVGRVRDVETPNEPKDSAAAMTRNIEQLLRGWKPDHEDLSPVIADIVQPTVDIAGQWTTDDGTLSESGKSSLSIHRAKLGRYSIEFHGCLSAWALQREGSYEKGVLRLNRPVEEYESGIYDTLYAASVDGTEYLISQAAIRSLVKQYPKIAGVNWIRNIQSYAFHRQQKGHSDPK